MKDRQNQTIMTHKWKWKRERLVQCTEEEWFDCMDHYNDDTGPCQEFETQHSRGGPLPLENGRPMLETTLH